MQIGSPDEFNCEDKSSNVFLIVKIHEIDGMFAFVSYLIQNL